LKYQQNFDKLGR